VIQHLYVQQFPCFDESLGQRHVLSIYMENRCGVIVRRT
jgi:hypothetical protein